MSGYPQHLIYFMWKWQVHYMISCKVAAESLFAEIDPRLLGTAFLIGFSTDDEHRHPPICFEPEKMQFLASDFTTIDSVSRKFAEIDPLRDMHYSGGMEGEMNARREQKNFREAIKDILDKSNSFNDKIHFVANGVLRDGYMVYVILQLKKSIFESYVFLHYISPDELFERQLSLIDATVSVYLEDCEQRLYLPQAGKDRGPERSYDEMLRAAARNFLYTVALVGRSSGFHTIYPACNALSLEKYEREENTGHLIICRQDHPALELTLELDAPFKIKEYRKLRKLLELTNDTIGVVTDSDLVLGLGRIMKNYDAKKEDVFHVYFRGLHCYDVMHESQPVLLMRYGKPEQVAQLIDFDKFAEDAQRIFGQVSEKEIGKLYILANAAARNDRGCMLVFAADAEQEAKRLGRQSIAIKPKKLDEETVLMLASIDGAVIVDLNGFAHAKGVILDGIAGLEGDASRGSRYNSALTYHEYRGWDKPTMIVVVSEDGMVDIIPFLKAPIRHSEIIQFIKTLESLNSAETFNDQTFYNTIELLKRREFYLTTEECNQLNTLKASLADLDHKMGKNMWRSFDDFVANPRMNERFYVNEH